MPNTLTYPGVYIQELPSGVHTIVGVSTSNAAFVGTAPRGPDNKPITVYGMTDYERIFGGIDGSSSMSFAVRDFFQNGGAQAFIVRVVGSGATAAKVTLSLTSAHAAPGAPASPAAAATLVLNASWKGALNGTLQVTVANPVTNSNGSFFDLTIVYTPSDATKAKIQEQFTSISTDPKSSRNLIQTLARSNLVVIDPTSRPPTSLPTAGVGTITDGSPGNTVGDADINDPNKTTGMYSLLQLHNEIFNLLCIPPLGSSTTGWTGLAATTVSAAMQLCADQRAMLFVDPFDPGKGPWEKVSDASTGATTYADANGTNAALYFPALSLPDPTDNNTVKPFAPCGAVAGIYAKTDAQRGVWKAPAGVDTALSGVPALGYVMSDPENGTLNQLGVNCLRAFPIVGRVVWGARTMRGADALADQWKYVPVRRTALFIESSLYRGLQWAVFEPNDEPLWAQIRLNVGAFMQNLFRQGAFQGSSPKDAYFVKCDDETTTQNDIDLGIVNIVVGFAPLKPAEFVVIKIQQMAGQVQT